MPNSEVWSVFEGSSTFVSLLMSGTIGLAGGGGGYTADTAAVVLYPISVKLYNHGEGPY